MWNELYELLLGLAGAGIVLAALYAFVASAQRQSEDDDEVSQSNAPRPEDAKISGHEPLTIDDAPLPSAPTRSLFHEGTASVAELYICPEAGAAMRRVTEVEAVAGRGLEGDRYYLNKGHWSESDECEVTMIAEEDLEQVTIETGISVRGGRHRRNLVTRNFDLDTLIGKRFRIGSAYFGAVRPRPPCLYLQSITEPGMARALVGRGGIGMHCFQSGTIRENDPIVVLEISLPKLLRKRWQALVGRT